ncbi:Aryl-alcohol dehydrogenase [Serratia ficaria]|uniref:Aryl-alcohol dehydrogenase n=2 Tax=Serratia ficaria TaxID=61651 RepID=A0A240BNT8_SERFI|nr:aryl-alcohol dehydrogenase [Serratia ficaria]CAI0857156.1 Aryl-alcohol dehydrogenase [Serratia ficaria]CAI0925425.1 Aryl-alcohol dehydrogenase [Serratia ficaria]CAI0976229.1 Aryl-alcohol dehydrogenase [Serratia ficaria]CAI2031440.1 Aryl-alcohol dehydrogenase [Serratia ficaria]
MSRPAIWPSCPAVRRGNYNQKDLKHLLNGQKRMNEPRPHRAAVVSAEGAPLAFRRLRLRPPRADEVRVRLAACGICHTDLSCCAGAAAGSILGHEGAGIVEQIGSAVRSVQPGDAVVLSYQSCGRCPACLRQNPAHCEHFWRLNFAFQRLDGSSGYPAPLHGHFFGQSSFASHSLANERNLVKVPKELPLPVLAPLGCGLQTGAGTVINTLDVQAGQSLLIVGVGTVGMAALMAARIRRAAPIIALDIHPQRLRLASELGATAALHGEDPQLERQLRRLAPQLDHAVETSGDARLDRLARALLRPGGGMARLAGGPAMKLSHDRRVLSVIQGDAVPQRFIPWMIARWQDGQFPFDRLIRFYPFQDINRALAEAQAGLAIKAVLRWD